MTMSTSSAPAATASRTSASLTASEARPEGKAVATEATATLRAGQGPLGDGHEVGVDAHGRDRRHGRVGRVGPAGLRAQAQHLARRVGSLERGEVDHADRHLEGPELGGGLDRAGRQRGRPRLGPDLVDPGQAVQETAQL